MTSWSGILVAVELSTAIVMFLLWWCAQKGYTTYNIIKLPNSTNSEKFVFYRSSEAGGLQLELSKDLAALLFQYFFILAIAFLVCLGLTSIGCHICKSESTGASEGGRNRRASVFYSEAEQRERENLDEGYDDGRNTDQISVKNESRDKVE